MTSRNLGKTELRIPSIVFGAMARRRQGDNERVEIIRTAIDHGLTTIDTAPLYDFGAAETQIAQAIADMPADTVQILTKVGLRWNNEDGYGEKFFEFTNESGQHGVVRKDSRPESIRWEVEQSLTRLQRETLDMVQIHQPDPTTPIAETMGALLSLKSEGKLRHIGVSNFSPEQVMAAQEAMGGVPLGSLQPEYSLVRRGIERDLLPLCIEHDIGVLAYSPLAGGVLTAASAEQSPPIRKAIESTLIPIAAAHDVSCATVALAWTAFQPGITAAICGASSPAQVVELSRALAIQLSADDLSRLSTAFARAQLRYPHEGKGVVRRARRLTGRVLRKLGLR